MERQKNTKAKAGRKFQLLEWSPNGGVRLGGCLSNFGERPLFARLPGTATSAPSGPLRPGVLLPIPALVLPDKNSAAISCIYNDINSIRSIRSSQEYKCKINTSL